MSEIKCLDNYHQLREMFQKGEKGNIEYFTAKIGIKPRTFHRLLNYLEKIDDMKVSYNKFSDYYYLN